MFDKIFISINPSENPSEIRLGNWKQYKTNDSNFADDIISYFRDRNVPNVDNYRNPSSSIYLNLNRTKTSFNLRIEPNSVVYRYDVKFCYYYNSFDKETDDIIHKKKSLSNTK